MIIQEIGGTMNKDKIKEIDWQIETLFQEINVFKQMIRELQDEKRGLQNE